MSRHVSSLRLQRTGVQMMIRFTMACDLSVRRVLPVVGRKGVGPWVFFDHMGPAAFLPGEGINVRLHPHINLAI